MAITQPSCADKTGFFLRLKEGRGEGKGGEGRREEDLSSLAKWKPSRILEICRRYEFEKVSCALGMKENLN